MPEQRASEIVEPGAGAGPSRISVSGSCSTRQGLSEDLALWERHGVGVVSVPAAKIGDGDARRVADAGIRVASVLALGTRLDDPGCWPRYRDRLGEVFEAARVMGAERIVLTTGAAGVLGWDDASDAFGAVLAPLLDVAPAPLAVEHTNQLRSDISFVHRLRDAVDLATHLGLGVVMETTACWQERDLAATIAEAVGVLGLVHVSDLGPVVLTTPDRLVPGDGVLPLTRLAALLLAAGYDGLFELEYAGPHIEALGYEPALARALPALEGILARAARAAAVPAPHPVPDERPT
ncbi:MAG TPA: TIM barrel protein [Acidimicrobiales bacterium]|nr:TIM barrel protein [Acidimicrobiales bacterium]